MTDLHSLLDVASRPASADDWDSPHDLERDLRLGRRALTRRRIAAAGGGVAAAGLVVGSLLGAASLFSGPGPAASPAAPAAPPAAVSAPADAGVLVDQVVVVGDFTFRKVPEGWVAGPSSDFAGLLVPKAGGVNIDPSVYVGKIVVFVEGGRLGEGIDGPANDGGTAVTRSVVGPESTRTLTVQVPRSAGLTRAQVTELANSVKITGNPDVTNG